MLRLNPTLFKSLKTAALAQKVSINAYCVSLLSQKTEVASEHAEVIQKLQKIFSDDLLGVVLFGSTARGTQTATSDVDLMIVLKSRRPIGNVLYRQWDNEFDSAKLSPHFVHLANDLEKVGSLWLEVALEGKTLSDPTRQIEKAIGKLRQLIAQGKFRRLMTYGVPYWKKVACWQYPPIRVMHWSAIWTTRPPLTACGASAVWTTNTI